MSNSTSVKKENVLSRFWWLGLLVFAVPVVIRKIQDVDLWWHMQIGRGVLSEGGIPDLRTFYWSHVSNLRPDDFRFTWLGDVLLHLGYQLGGAPLLQLSLLASVLLTVFLFFKSVPQQQRYLALPLAMLLVAGTYQLQIMRNAAFGILLFALVVWLWQRALQKPLIVYAMVPLLGFWSCVHGSYLLGFTVFTLLVFGHFAERVIAAEVEQWRTWVHGLVSLLLSFVAISIQNAFTIKALTGLLGKFSLILPLVGVVLLAGLAWFYFKQLRHWPAEKRHKWGNASYLALLVLGLFAFVVVQLYPFFTSANELNQMSLRLPAGVSADALGFLQKIQHGLNNMFWRAEGETIASLDFRSPFDFLGDVYVWSSLLLMFLALIALIALGKGRLALWTAFLPLCLLGLGYVRTIGLAGIFSVFVITQLWHLDNVWQRRLHWPSLSASLLLMMTLCGQLLNLGAPFGLYAEHRVGFGPASFFPTELGQEIQKDWPDQPTFTTIENGGFLLYQWYPEKRVFMDGFIGPHKGRALNLYNQAMAQSDPELLYTSVRAEHAVIGLRDRAWLQAFLQSPQWVPVHLSIGGMTFKRCAADLACDSQAKLLLTQAQFNQAPVYLKQLVQHYYLAMTSALLERGFLQQARGLWQSDHEAMIELSDENQKQRAQSLSLTLKHLEQQYQGQNSADIVTELAFYQALNRQNDRRAFELGRQLLDAQPKRGDIYLRMIETAQKLGNVEAMQRLGKAFEALQAEVRAQKASQEEAVPQDQ